MTFSNAVKSEDWVHFEWFLWGYNASVEYSGLQWDTEGYSGDSTIQCGGYNVSVGENHINSLHAFAHHKRKILQL